MSDSNKLSQSEIDDLLSNLTANLDESELDKNYGSSFLENFDEDRRGYKLYNFRRPDKFSKDHLKALQDIHKEFSRQLSLLLSAYLRLTMGVEVVSVDQLTYEEFTRSLPNPVTVCVLELNPLPGQIVLIISPEVTFSIVDRMLGGTGTGDLKSRELTDIEEALVKKIFEKIIKTLEIAWKGVFPVRGTVIGVDNNAILPQLASLSEITALTTLEIEIAEKQSGLLSICFPYPVLETVLGQLSTQHIFRSKGIKSSPEDKENILNKINNSDVKINVMLGRTSITVGDFIDLKEGDVLRLDNLVNDNLIVKVNEKPKFLGRPGTRKNKYAITIMDTVKSIESIQNKRGIKKHE
ncbi:MAG: flagellar motor switch protein FliM [Candidatus Melainabacteria bacterium GWF2_37_15]|nr:MAG: flagellar motor switch protein FliM [Candidatus Melainabacteria bacterium GWF2_37_15]